MQILSPQNIPPVLVCLSFIDMEPIEFEVQYVSEAIAHGSAYRLTMHLLDAPVNGHMVSNYISRQVQRQMEFFKQDEEEIRTNLNDYRFEMHMKSTWFSGCFIIEVSYETMDHSTVSPMMMTIGMAYKSSRTVGE